MTLFVLLDEFTRPIWGWKTPNIDYSLFIYAWRKMHRFKFSGERKEFLNNKVLEKRRNQE